MSIDPKEVAWDAPDKASIQWDTESDPEYAQYLAEYKKQATMPQIPGAPVPTLGKQMSEEEWKAQRQQKRPGLRSLVQAGAEQALNLVGGAGGMLVAPVVAGLSTANKLASGKPASFEKDYGEALGAASTLGSNIVNSLGINTDFTDKVNKGVQDVMKALPAVGPHIPTAGGLLPGAASALNIPRKPRVAPKEPTSSREAAADAYKQKTEQTVPEGSWDEYKKAPSEKAADDATVRRLEAAIAKQNPERAPIAVTKQGQAVPEGGMPYKTAAEDAAAQLKKEQDFWKERALKMQQEQQPVVPEVLRAQMEDVGNPYPVAGTPGQMEGLSRSVENLSFEETPPDGVIPRDSMRLPDGGAPMLTVPRGNEWVKDENGMPVRQGTPESTVAPDYINRYMRQDEQARADMGNAVMDANGPKLGQEDTFGSQPLEGFSNRNPDVGVTSPNAPAGVPGTLSTARKSQEGAIHPDLLTYGFSAFWDKYKNQPEGASKVLSLFRGTFDTEQLQKAYNESADPKGKERLVMFSPDQFHTLAQERPAYERNGSMSEEKRGTIRKALEGDKGLSSIPYLIVDDNGNVIGHEGRHRMDVAQEQGLDKVPVRVITHGITNDEWNFSKLKSQPNGEWAVNIDAPLINNENRSLNPWDAPVNRKPRSQQNQTGAVDFQAILDLFPDFAKTAVRVPVYHGTTKEIKGPFKTNKGFGAYNPASDKRAYPGDLGTWFSSTPEGTDTFAGARTGIKGGNVHQSYINLQNPKTFQTHADFLAWMKATTGEGQSANFARRQLIKEGHDGIVIIESKTDGGGPRSDYVVFQPEQIKSAISPQGAEISSGMGGSQRGVFNFGDIFGRKDKAAQTNTAPPDELTPKQPEPSTLLRPTSAEDIAKKRTLADKASAVGLEGTPYHRVTTEQEALAGISKKADISSLSPDFARSGSQAMARSNKNNSVINYVRNLLQEGRNEAEKLSKEYVTGPRGINRLFRSMEKQEWVDLAEVMQIADRKQIKITPEFLQTMNLSEKQTAFALRLAEALDARLASLNTSLMKQGFNPIEGREGYLPAMFKGGYTSFIGHYVTDPQGNKKFVTTGIAQADTKWGHNAAVAKYAEMGDKYSVALPAERRGLNTLVAGQNRTYSGFNELISQLAKHDESFAKAKAVVDQHAADAATSLYRFDVHEIKKQGVKGALGDRPWLTKEENAKQLMEAVIDYLETGFRYDSMLHPLTEMKKLAANADVNSQMPNTAKYLDKLSNHVRGNSLNHIGAMVNWGIDELFKASGVGSNVPKTVVREATNISSMYMMGLPNIGFGAMQLTQYLTGGSPEALALGKALNLSPAQITKSFSRPAVDLPAIIAGHDSHVPAHIKEAFQWAKDVGMLEYSEAELSHEVLKSNTRRVAENVINIPTRWGEKITRPPLFVAFADMFHEAGFRGEEALLRAQEATDYAMTNYHPDERPMMYQSLGLTGQLLGALTAYKHNFVEQQIYRAREGVGYAAGALKGKKVGAPSGAVGTSLGLAMALYGVSGMPGYQEASQLAEQIWGKSIREIFLDNPDKKNPIMDGYASYKTDADIASRLSQSSLFPDSPVQSMPHVANFANMIGAAYQYAVQQDTTTMRAAARAFTPTGARGLLEKQMFTNESGDITDNAGMPKYPLQQPDGTPFKRTTEEQRLRSALGIKPIRERLYDENTNSQYKREAVVTEKAAKLSKRFEHAVMNNDRVDGILKEWQDLGKDPQALLNKVDEIRKKSGKDPRQRLQGELTDTPESIRKHNAYNY